MGERLVNTLVVLKDNTWWSGQIPCGTVDAICRASQEGGQWHGTVILKKIEHFGEGEKIYIKDLLIEHNGRQQSKN